RGLAQVVERSRGRAYHIRFDPPPARGRTRARTRAAARAAPASGRAARDVRCAARAGAAPRRAALRPASRAGASSRAGNDRAGDRDGGGRTPGKDSQPIAAGQSQLAEGRGVSMEPSETPGAFALLDSLDEPGPALPISDSRAAVLVDNAMERAS